MAISFVAFDDTHDGPNGQSFRITRGSVFGGRVAAYASIHQAAAVSDCLRSSRPSTSLTSEAGTNAALKFTKMG